MVPPVGLIPGKATAPSEVVFVDHCFEIAEVVAMKRALRLSVLIAAKAVLRSCRTLIAKPPRLAVGLTLSVISSRKIWSVTTATAAFSSRAKRSLPSAPVSMK